MSNLALEAILVLTIAAAPGVAPADRPMPLRLSAEPVDAGIRLQVIGLSPVACEARYELEVAAAGGGNRSVQRGSVKLRPGHKVVLSTTTLGRKGAVGWSATLRVDSCDGRHFEEVKHGEG